MELFQIRQTPGRRAFKLIGELDLSSSHLLSMLEHLPRQGDVLVDLTELQFIDGASMAIFDQLACDIDGTLFIDNARPSIEKLLRRTGAQNRPGGIQFRTTYCASEGADQEIPDPARTLATAYSPESLCRRLVATTARTIDCAAFVGSILYREGQPAVAACSHKVARELDAAQIKCEDGPGLEAIRQRQITQSPSLLDERRWTGFTTKALYDGVASVTSIPLMADRQTVGVLSLYGQREGIFSSATVQAAAELADQSAFLIANALLYWDTKELVGQMAEALRSRAVIEQAKGILICRDGISPDEAFSALRTESQRNNLKIRDLAQQIVQSAATSSGAGSVHRAGFAISASNPEYRAEDEKGLPGRPEQPVERTQLREAAV